MWAEEGESEGETNAHANFVLVMLLDLGISLFVCPSAYKSAISHYY